MAVLVLAEHSNAALNDVTAKTVAAAKAFGGDIDVLVAGHNAGPAGRSRLEARWRAQGHPRRRRFARQRSR